MSIATSTHNFIEHLLGSISGILVDGLIGDQIGVEETRNNLSEESDRLLLKLLRVADVTECNFVERIL
jgi:hypothetical protein